MRICTAQQMAAIDAETIAGGVAGAELMERAGREIAQRIVVDMAARWSGRRQPVLVVCGKGNNGGDGLVIARLLAEQGHAVSVLLLAEPAQLSADARRNHHRLPAAVNVVQPGRDDWAASVEAAGGDAGYLVDAVFGTGIAPPLRGRYVDLVRAMNRLGLPTCAVDIPSGVNGDTGAVDPDAVRADLTVTVGLPKLGLVLAPGRDFVGRLEVVDIGFAPEVCRRHTENRHYLLPGDYATLLPPRASTTHKYGCGCLLVLAGSRAYGGAAVLAGLGALRSGVGLVTMAVPACLEGPVRSTLFEAIVAPLAVTEAGTLAPVAAEAVADLLVRKHAVAVGPGLGSDPTTDRFVIDFCAKLALPCVVDADGLSAFGRLRAEPRFSGGDVVLTPHAGELARMLDESSAAVLERSFELVPKLARRWGVTLVLKGSPTIIGDPDGAVWVNASGDDALAHGGTGDVLTGLIGGLLAQGLAAGDAARLSVYLHGVAGSLAARQSRRSVLAREVADQIGAAYGRLERIGTVNHELPHRLPPPA